MSKATANPGEPAETLNEWFLKLPRGRQEALLADKWMLAEAAYKAGAAAASTAALADVPEAASRAVMDILNTEAIAYPHEPKARVLASRLARAALLAAPPADPDREKAASLAILRVFNTEMQIEASKGSRLAERLAHAALAAAPARDLAVSKQMISLEAQLAEAREQRDDAISTLDAWFDRRKLSADAVDQAVLDAVSGYLRICSSGGMPTEDVETVKGVVVDMVRQSLFADLFSRALVAHDERKSLGTERVDGDDAAPSRPGK